LLNVLGCGSYSDTVNITYSNHTAPAFSLGPDTLLCPKQLFSLTASAQGATVYSWSTGSTQPTISISSPGNYYAFVSINNLCEVTDTANVTYRGDKKLDLRDTAICKGETLVLDADFGTGKYDWTVVPPVRDDQGVTDQSTFYVYKPGLYMVTAQVGECIYKDSAFVKFNDSLKLRLYPSRDTLLCYGEPWLLTASGNAESYIWQDGKRSTQYSVEKPGTYYVIAKNGCGADTATVNIAFKTCECELLLPTAFTPNGDGRNDVFRPLHACNMSDFSLRIFNRFGEQLFYSRNPQSGWDGTYNGRPQVTGTFVWSASYINTDNNRRYEKKGTVVVIR
jgi:gliding motility-associated-like protein